MEKKLVDMTSELGSERSHSAKLRGELGTANTQLETQRGEYEKTRKELEELKTLHKATLRRNRKEMAKLNITRQTLPNQLDGKIKQRSDLEEKFCDLIAQNFVSHPGFYPNFMLVPIPITALGHTIYIQFTAKLIKVNVLAVIYK